jgi:hypothetical protein
VDLLDVHAPLGGQLLEVPVMVAADQHHLEVMDGPPGGDALLDCGGDAPARVDEVPHEQQPPGPRPPKGPGEALQVILEDARGQGDAVLLEALGLAPVQVRHGEQATLGPVEGPLGEELHLRAA